MIVESGTELSYEEYAALWGCDPCYDRPPREPGDGYLFYNFNVIGHDHDFLRRFIPAIRRTLLEVDDRKDRVNLKLLLEECESRLEENL